MTLSTLARSLTALALLVPGLAVTAAAPAQAADPAYPFKDETVKLVDRPGWSADLVTGPDGASSYLSSTANSTVAQDYGLTANDPSALTDALRRSWAEEQPYAAPEVAGADSAALGYLDADTSLDAVYLVRGSAGARDSLVVTQSQDRGFASRGARSIAPGALSVTTTEKTASQPAYIWIRYADHLEALRVHDAPSFYLEPVRIVDGEKGAFLDLPTLTPVIFELGHI